MNKPWIQTYTGIKFTFLDPQLDQINIKDIAYPLSRICRFNGHCNFDYQVTEHCLHMSYLLPSEYALWGLLHDAAEAFIGDIATPVKNFCPSIKKIEDNILQKIAYKYNLEWPMPEIVHMADRRLLMTEKNCVMKDEPEPWPGLDNVEPYDIEIKEVPGKESYYKFINRFKELK